MKEGISGIDIARKIRQKDWESIIIMVTSHTELGYEALKAQIMLLDFISKYDECTSKLEKVLKKALLKVNSRKVLKFNSEGITFIIHIEDILYVTKDTIDRKSIIKTTKNEIVVNKTLNSIKEILDDRFYESHRSCIINIEKVDKIDWRNSIIYFENGDSIDMIARDRKKGLKDRVGC